MITIPAALSGSSVAGFTAPVYNNVADYVDNISKQVAVTSLGGTQVGVLSHSISCPFTLSVAKSKPAVLGKPNPVTGLISSVPRNKVKLLTRKGVLPQSGQPNQVMIIRTEIEVPAGADLNDIANVKAAISAHIGLLSNQSVGIGDTALNGVL